MVKSMKNIQKVRESRGFSRAELAERSGLTEVTIYYLETGKVTRPRYDTLKKIADALAVSSIDVLVNGK